VAAKRLSHLQRRILAWLAAEERRTRGTLSAEHHALVLAMNVDKGNLSSSLKSLERKGLIQVQHTPGGKADAIDLTPTGRTQVEVMNKELQAVTASEGEAMASVKRDGLKQRNRDGKEPHSKLKYFWSVLHWVPWVYGVLVLLGQGMTFWISVVDSISPRITAEAKSDQTSISDVEFTFKNEGWFTLRDVVLNTLFIWYEFGQDNIWMPSAEDARVVLRDRYSFLGEILGRGGTATANLTHELRHSLKEDEKKSVFKKIGICQELSFQISPLTWLPSKWFPVRKLTWDIGYMVDKPAGVPNWRQLSCTALRKNMPDREQRRRATSSVSF
jgi:DNA-binding MarR family transcriptional regulator